jgi:hypothetical protein
MMSLLLGLLWPTLCDAQHPQPHHQHKFLLLQQSPTFWAHAVPGTRPALKGIDLMPSSMQELRWKPTPFLVVVTLGKVFEPL